MSTPLISIIVLSYERPWYAEATIPALIEKIDMDRKDYEIIIADDGSDEGVMKRLAKLPHDVILRSTRHDELGPGYTLNLANSAARGKYILNTEDDFLLADDGMRLDLAMEALDTIDNLELVRLRRWESGPLDKTKTDREIKLSDGTMFQLVQRRIVRKGVIIEMGYNYGYGNATHLRKATLWRDLGPYLEDASAQVTEKEYAGRFNMAEYYSGRFDVGWFTHIGRQSTTYIPSAHRLALDEDKANIKQWHKIPYHYNSKVYPGSGINIQHKAISLALLDKVIQWFQPKLVIELGYAKGGLTLLFHESDKNMEVVSFDKKPSPRENSHFDRLFGPQVSFFREKVLWDQNDRVVSYIKRKEKKILYCDNGAKIEEVKVYAKYLSPGDMLGVHDWGTEIKYEDIKDELVGFEPYKADMFEGAGSLSRFWIKVK